MGHRCPQQPFEAVEATATSKRSQTTPAQDDADGQHLPTLPERARKGRTREAPSLRAAIDYGNRRQYREHGRMQQQSTAPPRCWWLSLDLLLIWTVLPKSAQWTSKNQRNNANPPLPATAASISNSSSKRRRSKVSACRVEYNDAPVAAGGDQWSVKHKSLPLPSATRCSNTPQKTMYNFVWISASSEQK
uniref:Uncharacterized protein n=1 Tax=Anopheles farauti TaxID=69004 RepID=A0A182Q4K4_9DIPT